MRENAGMVWLAIAVGGALGSMARHGVNVLVHGRWPMMRFPLATFLVNVAGCLVIGLLAGLIVSGRISKTRLRKCEKNWGLTPIRWPCPSARRITSAE